MCDWKDTIISEDSTIKTAMQVIDSNNYLIALVVDSQNRLLGTVTDGDIRRGLLRNVDLDKSVMNIANTTPITASTSDNMDAIRRQMKENYVRQLPILDKDGKIVRLELLRKLLQVESISAPVVIMAGGLGTRLRPLTNSCPKPLLPVGGKPVLEITLENLLQQHFKNFFFSVNYKAQMIERHFGDGSRWGADISYLRESKRLGTGGALSLLPPMDEPIIVMNGDLLTQINFKHLLDFHRENNATATIGVCESAIQIPYGVVDVDNYELRSIREKPLEKFFVNAGIYVLSPEAVRMIPKDTYYDMTTLFETLLKQGRGATVFPIREFWLDIGQMDDYEKANGEYAELADCQGSNDPFAYAGTQ
ncbi:nucleotidyltransferase family protein [Desulfovibrio ferrophilus]|uniref:Putative mannose-1-phosphate guanyltransferase n=1 Tax=Desulfovibrio ferrophilus TaxID=241368 RepID=A0A2Z6B1C0_9BACT|nr:nucleotidyltransferase family protein [Desulfovibrio ferrophilus]BBD09312.1 putative mannose-1-phosphate guanyltransferase [Desulfovibrio ferrophilus]